MSPILVLVPGSFGSSEMYDPVVLPLREKGYTIHVLDLLCYPGNYAKGKAPPSMYDDADAIREFVEKVADENGDDIVMMAHSYGGIPATQSLQHISASARSSQGKKGGVSRIAYLTALAPALGESLTTSISGGLTPTSMPPMDVDQDGWLSHVDPSATAALCYNSLPADQGTILAARFGRHSSVCFGDKVTYTGYKHVDVSWFFCEEDLCVVPEVQQAAIDRIEDSWKGTEREGRKVHVERVGCDHIPVYSSRDRLELWMENLLK